MSTLDYCECAWTLASELTHSSLLLSVLCFVFARVASRASSSIFLDCKKISVKLITTVSSLRSQASACLSAADGQRCSGVTYGLPYISMYISTENASALLPLSRNQVTHQNLKSQDSSHLLRRTQARMTALQAPPQPQQIQILWIGESSGDCATLKACCSSIPVSSRLCVQQHGHQHTADTVPAVMSTTIGMLLLLLLSSSIVRTSSACAGGDRVILHHCSQLLQYMSMFHFIWSCMTHTFMQHWLHADEGLSL